MAAESCVYFFLAYLFLLERCTGMGPICCFVGVFWFVFLEDGFIFCGEGGFKSLLGWSFFFKVKCRGCLCHAWFFLQLVSH